MMYLIDILKCPEPYWTNDRESLQLDNLHYRDYYNYKLYKEGGIK